MSGSPLKLSSSPAAALNAAPAPPPPLLPPCRLPSACLPVTRCWRRLACRVCRTWRAAVAREAPWRAAWQRDCPEADTATIAALSQLDAPPGGTGRQVYRALTQAWTCDYCQQQFTDGANSRGSSCSYHPGILFSGGRLNGTGLRYTCCSRRAHHIPNGSRDNNGCAATFHVGGNSAWQRHGTVSKAGGQRHEPVAWLWGPGSLQLC